VTADELRAVFDAAAPLTVGLEEEAMLLDPESLDLAPVAARVVAAAGGGLKPELPAPQVEIATAPARRVPEAIAELAAGRRALRAAADGIARPAAAGAHPFAAPLGELSAGDRYEAILADYGDVARAQQVCALQVHVAVGSADATLAVYNALRGHLPELAALAANAPFHGGRDTGLASVRPLIAGLLPRQGMPPVIRSWEAFAESLRWGKASGAVPEATRWWWELRPHVAFGTLELRVPDAQTTMEEASAVAAFAHALVAWLAERHAAGEPLGAPEDWRIAENRWVACRYGLDGHFADLDTGDRRPVRDVLHARLEQLAPVAERIGCAAELARARALAESNGAPAQRAVAAQNGLPGLARWLAERY
jgi:carboxylate-amine ligase